MLKPAAARCQGRHDSAKNTIEIRCKIKVYNPNDFQQKSKFTIQMISNKLYQRYCQWRFASECHHLKSCPKYKSIYYPTIDITLSHRSLFSSFSQYMLCFGLNSYFALRLICNCDGAVVGVGDNEGKALSSHERQSDKTAARKISNRLPFILFLIIILPLLKPKTPC